MLSVDSLVLALKIGSSHKLPPPPPSMRVLYLKEQAAGKTPWAAPPIETAGPEGAALVEPQAPEGLAWKAVPSLIH